MRAIRVASAVLLGAGALASCVPTAYAAVRTDFGFAVEPSTVAAGERVTLRVVRNAACRGEAVVSSPVFDLVAIPPTESSARAVVDWDAKPGAVYDVEFVCDESSGTARLTIASTVRPSTPHTSRRTTHRTTPRTTTATRRRARTRERAAPSRASTSRRSASAPR